MSHVDEHPNYNKSEKIILIRECLKDIKKRKTIHYDKFCTMKKINGVSRMVVHISNALSVCSLVLTFLPINKVCFIIALSSTSLSAIVSAMSTAYDLEQKVYSHQTSYLQYLDIYRDISARLYRNGLSSQDLDYILAEINSRLGLIEDNSLPISVSSTNDVLLDK